MHPSCIYIRSGEMLPKISTWNKRNFHSILICWRASPWNLWRLRELITEQREKVPWTREMDGQTRSERNWAKHRGRGCFFYVRDSMCQKMISECSLACQPFSLALPRRSLTVKTKASSLPAADAAQKCSRTYTALCFPSKAPPNGFHAGSGTISFKSTDLHPSRSPGL